MRKFLYLLGRILGDLQAIKRGLFGKRLLRRGLGKVSGKILRKLTK